MKDLVIIGGGPGGYSLASKANALGLDVCLIEKENLGGTCLNYGCIPTKTLYTYAKNIDMTSKLFNKELEINYLDIINKKDEIIESLKKGINEALKNINIITGTAKLISNNKVEVNNEILEAKNIVIASGSKTKYLNIKGLINNPNVIDSKELLSLTTLPDNLVIIGGGVIGIEIASILNKFKVNVTVVEAFDSILPNIDKDISRRLTSYLKTQGIRIITKANIIEVSENKLILEKEELDYDKILLSVGRSPNLDNLGLDELKIEYTNKGIIVDNNFETNVKGIYAIGDVTGKMMLAHYATASGYIALNHILSKENNIDLNIVPSCIFSFPEIGLVGKSEEEIKNQGINYRVIKKMYRSNGKANAMQETDGFLKLIVDENDYIISASIIGENADILIHEIMILINGKISLNKAKDFIFAHPTLSEILSDALNC